MNSILIITIVLILIKCAVQLWLERINVQYANTAAKSPLDNDHYTDDEKQKSLDYLKAKTTLSMIDLSYGSILLGIILVCGILPWCYQLTHSFLPTSVWTDALYLFGITILITSLDMPLDWYRQFVLEEKFGFNKSTQRLWWWDRILGLIIATILLYPLLALILWIVGLVGSTWWFWVWLVLIVYQLIMIVVAPNWIMPLFNKFAPMEEGSLKQRLAKIASKAGVEFGSISVMDGSKRSTHSNAFLTGLGKFKKIALYDTLIKQLNEDEITAVTAHELGHYVRKHIIKRMVWMSGLLLAELFVVSVLIQQTWLLEPFGFETGNFTTGLLLISLLSGLITFWLNPLENYYSRKHEYEADAYAKEIMNEHQPMVTALQTIEKANLGNPTPHPLYSCFYYSHPSVQERVKALTNS